MLVLWTGVNELSIPLGDDNVAVLRPQETLDIPESSYNLVQALFPDDITTISSDDNIRKTVVSIPSYEILALNTTPKIILPSPGLNRTIFVEKVVGYIVPRESSYQTNVDLELRYDLDNPGDALGSLVISNKFTNLLIASDVETYLVNGRGEIETKLESNKSISAIVPLGNPTVGDGDIEIHIYYRIISL